MSLDLFRLLRFLFNVLMIFMIFISPFLPHGIDFMTLNEHNEFPFTSNDI